MIYGIFGAVKMCLGSNNNSLSGMYSDKIPFKTLFEKSLQAALNCQLPTCRTSYRDTLCFNPMDTEGEFFSYLLNFCRQWQLCMFLILGLLSTHLFGLVFSCPTSEKVRVEFHLTSPSPLLSSVVLRWDFLKLCFMKKNLYFFFQFSKILRTG